jgi:hypothetical protein
METCKPSIHILLEPGREPPTPKNGVVAASFQKPRERSFLTAENFSIALLPKMPAAKKKEGRGGVARHPARSPEKRQVGDVGSSGDGHANGQPEPSRRRAMEQQVARGLQSGVAQGAGGASDVDNGLAQEIVSGLDS